MILERARRPSNRPEYRRAPRRSQVNMYGLLVEPEAESVESARPLAERARDRVRFEEDALRLADDVYRVARRLTGSANEAEDLVQEAYVRAFRSWEQYRPGTNLRAWLLRIVHNLAIDASRKRARTPQTEPVEEGDYYLYNRLGATAPDESEAALERLSQGGVVTALASLPHQYRDTVVLVDLADFSYQDAADILDVPIGTVMSRLHRGRRMLKTRLAQSLDGDAEEVA
jgi:RNA polymerase sigma-70 factor (ECF subfamily)